MSDSLRNSFSHTENGQKNRILVIEHIKPKAAIATLNVLQQNGYIRGYRLNLQKPKQIEILPKYKNQEPAINKTERPLRTSRKRVYISLRQRDHNELLQGTLIISTSKGITSDVIAHKKNVGGELLAICKVMSLC